jgi:hypothetical protein
MMPFICHTVIFSDEKEKPKFAGGRSSPTVRPPQSSCLFKSSRQNFYGLGQVTDAF